MFSIINAQRRIAICCTLLLGIGTTRCFDGSKKSKKAIVVGATSGMGREVAKLLCKKGYVVGLVGRREELLNSLQAEISGVSYVKRVDVTSCDAQEQLRKLIQEMGGLDLIVVSISAYLDNRQSMADGSQFCRTWKEKERTLDVDFKGFIAIAEVAFEFFMQQKHGHFVGISSTSGQRGMAVSPDYSAAKAGISCYMEAMRNFMTQQKINVQISDVVAGWVAVEHSPKGSDPAAYWEISAQEAAVVIVEGIKAKKEIIYVPRTIWMVAWLLSYLPDFLYNRYFTWL